MKVLKTVIHVHISTSSRSNLEHSNTMPRQVLVRGLTSDKRHIVSNKTEREYLIYECSFSNNFRQKFLHPAFVFEIGEEADRYDCHDGENNPEIIGMPNKRHAARVHTEDRGKERKWEGGEGDDGKRLHYLVLLGR